MDTALPRESYCGPAPLPADLLARWNFDSLLLAALAVLLVPVMLPRVALFGSERRAWLGAWLVAVMLFVSPLCALTVALFSARIVNHALLVAVLAPLVAMAIGRRMPWARHVLVPLLGLQTVVFWAWHLPAAYDLALSHDAVYWLMQGSLLATATLLWAGVLDRRADTLSAVGSLLGLAIQMGMLGALLTFAPEAIYLPHLATTAPFGLSPLEDQQLAGLIMWVPANIPVIAAGLWLALREIRLLEAPRPS